MLSTLDQKNKTYSISFSDTEWPIVEWMISGGVGKYALDTYIANILIQREAQRKATTLQAIGTKFEGLTKQEKAQFVSDVGGIPGIAESEIGIEEIPVDIIKEPTK